MVVALKFDNTVVSEGKKIARDYISLRATGMTFTELMALGDAIIEVKDAAILAKNAIIEKQNTEISALNASNTRLIEKFMETFEEISLKAVQGMIKADFSLEKIADILDFKMDYVKELAAIEPK